jgi:hypothetical protein
MADPKDKLSDIGFSARPDTGPGLHLTDIGAAVLAVVWLIAALFYVFRSGGPAAEPGLVMSLLVIFLPQALIWIAVSTLRTVRALREEAIRLQSVVEAMRQAHIASQQMASTLGTRPMPARRPPVLPGQAADRRAALVPPPQPATLDEQAALALGTTAEEFRAPLAVADFIRAVDFPQDEDDKEGFRALRLALEDRNVARLIRAAQDVLTLLSQDGIYMDDLTPDPAAPALWRRFAKGERGRGMTPLGGIRDRDSLARASQRLREDPVFRDACHHFLRTFDVTLAAFNENATDDEIAALAESRTARAFMLIGRASGTFD